MALSNAGIIVVGIDGSEAALVAARWAAVDAIQRGATLRLVHAVQAPPTDAYPEPALLAPQVTAQMRARAAKMLQVVADRLIEDHSGLAIETVQRDGRPARVLLDQSMNSIATVVGADRENRLVGSLFGSVAARMTARGNGAVVIARPNPLPSNADKTAAVVVGVDGSSHARAAVGFAYEEAALRGAPLVAIHTWNDKPLEHALGTYPLEINAQNIDDRELRILESELAGWEHKFPQVPVRLRVIRGRPTPTLLRYSTTTGAQPTQLIVVGSRGRGGFSGLLLGSTSQALAAHAECSVAVVHERKPAFV